MENPGVAWKDMERMRTAAGRLRLVENANGAHSCVWQYILIVERYRIYGNHRTMER